MDGAAGTTGEAAALEHFVNPLPLMKARADAASDLLLRRLPSHLLQRDVGVDRHNHPVLTWFVSSLRRGVAELVRRGCIGDVQRARCGDCILTGLDRFILVERGTAANQGCYLFYDTVRRVWVRSGKACGSLANFISRLEQHVAGSKAGGSYFYDCYPSSTMPVRAKCASCVCVTRLDG